MTEIVNRDTGEVAEIITKDDEGKLIVQKNVIEAMSMIERQKKELTAQFDTYREALKQAMEEYGVTKIDSDELVATYVAEHEQIKLDSKAVKEFYPKVYEDCTKLSPVKASVRVRLKV